MKTAIRKMGNSQGVIIPKPLLEQIGAKANDQVELKVSKGRILIAPVPAHPRSGWAEASKRLRKAGDAGLAWPESTNKSDKKPKW